MNRKRPAAMAAALALSVVLAGCNAADPTLGVAQPAGNQQAAATGPVAITPPPSAGAVQNASARVHVAPIIGSTVVAVTPLSRRLAEVAPASGISLVADTDPARTHIIKGYFSALAEGGGTTVVFVWDVFDPQGVRLHRIQGQEAVAGSAADPWSIVPPAVMERIADRLVTDFRAWQAGTVPAAPAVAAPLAPAAPAPAQAPLPARAAVPAPAVTPVTPAPPPSTGVNPSPAVPAPPGQG
jgi:hypothetical protein